MTAFDASEYGSSKYAITMLMAWLVPRLYMNWNRTLLQWIRYCEGQRRIQLLRLQQQQQQHSQQQQQQQQTKQTNHSVQDIDSECSLPQHMLQTMEFDLDMERGSSFTSDSHQHHHQHHHLSFTSLNMESNELQAMEMDGDQDQNQQQNQQQQLVLRNNNNSEDNDNNYNTYNTNDTTYTSAQQILELSRLKAAYHDEIRQGLRQMNQQTWWKIVGSLAVIGSGSFLILYGTEGLDPNMLSVLAGLSRLVSSLVFFYMSLDIPLWLGVYSPIPKEDTQQQQQQQQSESSPREGQEDSSTSLEDSNESPSPEERHGFDYDYGYDYSEENNNNNNNNRMMDLGGQRSNSFSLSTSSSSVMSLEDLSSRASEINELDESIHFPLSELRDEWPPVGRTAQEDSGDVHHHNHHSHHSRSNTHNHSRTARVTFVDGFSLSPAAQRKSYPPNNNTASARVPPSAIRSRSHLEPTPASTNDLVPTVDNGDNSPRPNNSRDKFMHQDEFERLRNDLSKSIVVQFSNITLLIWLFSCGDSEEIWVWSLPTAWIGGLFWGFVLTFGIYLGRTRLKLRTRRRAAIATVIFLIVLTIFGVELGVWFIQDVWFSSASFKALNITSISAMVATLLVCIIAHAVAYQRRREAAIAEANAAASNLLQPQEEEPDAPESTTTTNVLDTTTSTRGRTSSVGSMSTKKAGSSAAAQSETVVDFELALFSPRSIATTLTKQRARTLTSSSGASTTSVATSMDDVLSIMDTTAEGLSATGEHTMDLELEDDDEDDESKTDEPSATTTLPSSGWKHVPTKCKALACCCCRRRYQMASPSCAQRLRALIQGFFKFVVNGLCVYMIVVNIGATQQGNHAKALFPTVHPELYLGQENGPVCAYQEAFNDEVTETFPSAQAALEANYTIAHCGECAACSKWQNLEVQWTTRHNLAILSHKCAKVLLFSGFEKAMQCHYDIGFDEACSECWIQVESCATQHCAFIQMQAWIIAQLGNFEVGPEVVTAAMCEEAICEVDFVPCSGANRRRMNIVSDIARPGKQQCPLVEESNAKWEALFGPEDKAIVKSSIFGHSH